VAINFLGLALKPEDDMKVYLSIISLNPTAVYLSAGADRREQRLAICESMRAISRSSFQRWRIDENGSKNYEKYSERQSA
jgi:hypothetical protein